MRDITPTLKIGTPEEAQKATFAVTYAETAQEAYELIEASMPSGTGGAMVPTEEIARETLELLECPPEQIEYLLSWYPDPNKIRLP